MEGGQKGMRPILKRDYEGNRLEEEILALAYERVWPLVRRKLRERRLVLEVEAFDPSSSVTVARRA